VHAVSQRSDATARDERSGGDDARVGRGRLAAFALIAALIIAADQATKEVVRRTLAVGETWPEGWELIRIAHVQNSGAAFGIFQGGGVFLVASSIIAIVAIAVFLFWAPGSRLYTAALSLILGGAIGNLIDRVARGVVTDFIDPTHYPAFNIADSAIVVGVSTLILLTLLEERRERALRRTAAPTEEQA
jgi:signal peptidase II